MTEPESGENLDELLVCPKCGYDGNTDEGHGFRYLEDTVGYRDVEGVKNGQLVIHSLWFTDEGYGPGQNPRFECRRHTPWFCGHEWPVPEWALRRRTWL